jgi:DNA-binding CsgD family transcriptional regulator/tetratricopeptide (TPR) repeat protein
VDPAPPFIARERELDLLQECLDAAGSGRAGLVLLRGESGMGKSRLVGALVERAIAAGVLAVVGHCTPVSGGELPFGPFVEVLSRIGATRDDLGRVAGTPWDVLRSALIVSAPPSAPASPDIGLERSRLFTSVLWVLHRLGEAQPVLVVLEDIHWADSSSLDLLNYLARTAGRERLLVVATCRDDALAADASRRRAVRDLGRADLAREVRLEPFTAEQVTELLTVSAARLGEDERAKVVELCDGNPFIALELAALDTIEGGHTEALRQAVLGPVDELDEGARFALHVAAVLGESMGHEVLEEAVEGTVGDAGAHLRSLADRGLLVAGRDRYEFRHAILRESVVAEMLRSERAAAHRAAALGLRRAHRDGSGEDLVPLAHHLVASADHAQAFPAVLAAADYARGIYAFAEARRQLSLARRELWQRVEDPERLSGLGYADLLRREAEMARWAGEPSAAVDILREGLAAAPPQGPDRALLELELGEALWAAGDPAGALASYRRSEAALAPGDVGQELLGRVLAALSQGLVATGQYEAAAAAAERAVALADEAGAARTALQARITLATALTRHDGLEDGVSRLRECLAESFAADAFKAVVRCYGNLAFLHSSSGQFHEAVQVGQEAQAACRRFGPLLLVAPTLAENWVHALVATGRWDEAERLATELEGQWSAEGMALALHVQLAQVAAARGDRVVLARELAVVEPIVHPDDPYTLHDVTTARVEDLLWRGEAAAAHRLARTTLDELGGQQDVVLVLGTCALALRALADLVTAGASGREAPAGELEHLLGTARDAAQHATSALERAHLLVCEAEASRATRARSAGPWTAAVERWEALGCPYPTAYAQWREAEELFGARARVRGTRSLAAALATADAIGAVPLATAVRTLARHAGVAATALSDHGSQVEAARPATLETPDHIPVTLTPRERDVLLMLTRGHTNQQIARRLFITESTVSVHVSHIIAKLGVSNRLQAAAAAHRLNLFPAAADEV